MAFNVGTLVATIQLQGKPQFDSDLDSTGQKFGHTASLAEKAGAVASSAFRGAALAIGAGTVAATAYVSSLFKTGVAYNQLQQSSRAALSTLLGGTKAANAQMDKLDDFAKNSPFAKSVFITAQQQLLGFGLEAKKVVPALSAIQDAVAAVGGSNEQISQITYALAQMRGQGKLTGRTLNQLGQFGIDAASLLGKKMHKTGAEIRDMATKPGGIPVDQVWDPLVSSLEESFGGAAANVKQTFSGTLDRIKAASRDIGAALAEPFVGKNSGGLFVTWGNQVADVMRGVQGQIGPIVSILEMRAMPAFAAITSALDKAKVVVKSWDSSKIETGLDKLSQYGPAIAAVGGAVLAVNANFLKAIPVLGQFVPALNPVVTALAGIALASPEVRAAGGELIGAFRPLIPVTKDLARVVAGGLNQALPVVAGLIKDVANVATPLVRAISGIPAPVLLGVAAFLGLNKVLGPLEGGLKTIGLAFVNLKEQMAVQAALGAMEGNTSRLAGTFGVAGKAATGMGTAIKTAFLSNPIGLALTAIALGVALITSAMSAASQKTDDYNRTVQTLKGTLDETSGAVTAATRAQVANNLLLDDSGNATDNYTKALKHAHIASNSMVQAITGNTASYESMRDMLVDNAKAQVNNTDAQMLAQRTAATLGVSYDTVIASALGNKDATKELEDAYKKTGRSAAHMAQFIEGTSWAIQNQAPDAAKLTGFLNDQRKATQEALEQQKLYADAVSKASDNMSDAARSNARLNDALAIARDVSKDATTRLKALKQALDELNGGTKTQEQNTRDLNEQIDTLGSAFEQTDDKGKKLAKSLVDSAGSIDTTTDAGRQLFDQVDSLNDKMLDAMRTAHDTAVANGDLAGAYDASVAAAEPYQKALRKAGDDADLSADQINGMVGAMLSTPEVVAYLITDNGSVDTQKQQLLTLAQKILSTPSKSIDVDAPTIKPIKADLEAMGFKVKSLPDGKFHVTANGISTINDALNNLTRTRTVSIIPNWIYTSPPSGSMLQRPNADGGMYRQGVKAFADGGFPSGMYKGRREAIHKFAEWNTNWETYISGKTDQRSRNQRILAMTAPKLGMAVVPVGNSRSTAFANGGFTGGSPVTRAVPEEQLIRTEVNVNLVNPVTRDPIDDIRTAAQAAAASLGGL